MAMLERHDTRIVSQRDCIGSEKRESFICSSVSRREVEERGRRISPAAAPATLARCVEK